MPFTFQLKQALLPCKPPLWARGGHAQTILGYLFPSPLFVEKGELWKVPLTGNDFGIAHFYAGESDTIVYLFHGLGGYSHGSYMQRIAAQARALGHSVVLSNHRGCGEGRGLAKEPYHSGRAEDLSAVIAMGREKFPAHKHLAIGFSLSGNALLLLAASQRAKVLPDVAIAVNAPINLEASAKLLKKGWSRIYDYRFVRELGDAIQSRRIAGHNVREVLLSWGTTLHEFDDLYTAPEGGFKNREEYYHSCSAKPYLSQIQIPTILLSSDDDPFVSAIDYYEAKLSPLVHLHMEAHGGHMGYLNKEVTPLGTKRWLDYALATYIKAFQKL